MKRITKQETLPALAVPEVLSVPESAPDILQIFYASARPKLRSCRCCARRT